MLKLKKSKGMIHSKFRLVFPLMEGRKMRSKRHIKGFKWTDNTVFLKLSDGQMSVHVCNLQTVHISYVYE